MASFCRAAKKCGRLKEEEDLELRARSEAISGRDPFLGVTAAGLLLGGIGRRPPDRPHGNVRSPAS